MAHPLLTHTAREDSSPKMSAAEKRLLVLFRSVPPVPITHDDFSHLILVACSPTFSPDSPNKGQLPTKIECREDELENFECEIAYRLFTDEVGLSRMKIAEDIDDEKKFLRILKNRVILFSELDCLVIIDGIERNLRLTPPGNPITDFSEIVYRDLVSEKGTPDFH